VVSVGILITETQDVRASDRDVEFSEFLITVSEVRDTPSVRAASTLRAFNDPAVHAMRKRDRSISTDITSIEQLY
jgi:hypothetical protein